GDVQLFTDLAQQARLDLPMPGHARLAVVGGVIHRRVSRPLAPEAAPVLPEVLEKLLPFHRSGPSDTGRLQRASLDTLPVYPSPSDGVSAAVHPSPGGTLPGPPGRPESSGEPIAACGLD